MKDVTKYSTGTYSRPSEDVSEKTKLTNDYGKSFAEYIYSSWAAGRSYTSYSDYQNIIENRKYAQGEQDTMPYKGYFFNTDAQGLQKESMKFIREKLANINWTPIAVAVKFVNIILNMFEDANPDMMFIAIDPDSVKKKRRKKAWMKAQIENKKQFEGLNKKAGAPVFNMDEDLPRNVKELQMYDQFGLIRLQDEEAYEAGVQEVWDRCDEKEIKRNMILDFINAGRACVREYVDPATCQLKKEYLDIARAIVAYANKDYTNPEYAGYIREMTISQVAAITDLQDHELKNIAQTYRGHGGNGNYGLTDSYWSETDSYGVPLWYEYKVYVLDYEFVSTTRRYFTTKQKGDGTEHVYEEKYSRDENGYERPPRIRKGDGKRKTNVYGVERVYEGCWIIGTGHMISHGLQNDVPVKKGNSVSTSYHFYRLPNDKPMLDVMKPHIDEMTMAVYNMQNIQATAPGPGFYIDVNAINKLNIDNNDLSPFDIIKIGTKGGVLLYESTTNGSSFAGQMASQARPVEYYPGGMGTMLQEYMSIFEFHRRQIQEFIGLPDIAAAGTEKQDTTLGEQRIRFASSTNAVKHFLTGYLKLAKESAINICYRMAIIAKYNKEGYKVMERALGYQIANQFKLTPMKSLTDIGIEVRPVLNASSKEELLAMAYKRNLPQIDILKLKMYLEAGRLRKAEVYFAFRDREMYEMQMQMQQMNMMLNNQAQQKTNAMDEQDKRKTKVLDHELDKDMETHKKKLEDDHMILDKSMSFLGDNVLQQQESQGEPS
jgi:hypothetical protein